MSIETLDVRALRADHLTRHTQACTGGLTESYSAEELEFVRAIDRYKRENRRPFPDWSEVLLIARALGYRKAEPELSPELAARRQVDNAEYARRMTARRERREQQRARLGSPRC